MHWRMPRSKIHLDIWNKIGYFLLYAAALSLSLTFHRQNPFMSSCRQPGETGAGRRAWHSVFLDGLRATGNVSESARAANICRSRVYECRHRDPVFAAAWADALEAAADRLEMEAFRRAVEGIGEDRFFRGDVVGRVTRYSDRLLMFLLKARRPERFDGAQSQKDTGNDEEYVAELRRRMARLSGHRDTGPD